MKNTILEQSGKTNILKVAMFVGIAAVVTSCGKSDDFVTPSPKKEQVATESMLQARNGAPAPGMYSIAQIAINNGSFNELVQALSYVDAELNAGQVDMLLNGNNQYTVFVPTGAAFNNLHTALNITDITDLPAALVLDVLKHHVVEGRRAANSVLPQVNNVRTIETLLGVTFQVNSSGSITAVGNTANISASNGIFHVIDAVILPIN